MLGDHSVGLRAIEASDLPQLLEWRNQPSFRRFFREYRELSSDHQAEWFADKVLRDPCTRMFSIIKKSDRLLIGACGLCYIDWINKNADFSIYIGFQDIYVDKILALEAGKVLLDYGFGELGLHRVWCEIYDFDDRKRDFLPFLGFELEGRHRQTHWSEGKWHDSLFYGLLRKDFVTGTETSNKNA